MKNNKIKVSFTFAFTLAETLITLVIVGVVAALTVPNLINNIQKNELHSQFNKAIKVSSEAVQRMKIDYGDIVYDNENDNANIFRERFMHYFSVICKEDCLNKNQYKNFANLSDTQKQYFNNCFTAQDGMTFCFYKGGTSNIYITIDINSTGKRPNRWGYDVFTFNVNLTDQIFKPDQGGKCDKTSEAHNGRACAKKAMSDPNYFKNLK